MDKYIGVKLIEAEPMTQGQFQFEKTGEKYPEDWPNALGYKGVYLDGHASWSPKDVFEKAHMKIIPNPMLKTDVSISQQMVDDFIKEIHVSTLGEKTTLVRAVLVNGFELLESSACVDVANYNETTGAGICLDKIRDKIWFLLGFLLQTGVNGIK